MRQAELGFHFFKQSPVTCSGTSVLKEKTQKKETQKKGFSCPLPVSMRCVLDYEKEANKF